MSGGGAAGAAERIGSGFSRAVRAWRVMGAERRLAAYAAIGLVLTLFLPWYQETLFADGAKKLESASASITGWGAFSFVEAAMLLVAAGVLTLLFQRAEGRAFHLPGGDGWVIIAAGFWSCVLIVWRIFDKQGGTVHGQIGTTYGIEWGVFVALAVAALLAYSGYRIRATHQAEPPLPGEHDKPRPRNAHAGDRATATPATRAGRRASAMPAAFPAPPAWSGGDVPTFDTHRLGGDPPQDSGPPTPPPETVTRVRDPDRHDQPTVPIKRRRGDGDT